MESFLQRLVTGDAATVFSPPKQRIVSICLAPSWRNTRDGGRGKNGITDAFSFNGAATSATTASPRAKY
jgi:hypothetical protein